MSFVWQHLITPVTIFPHSDLRAIMSKPNSLPPIPIAEQDFIYHALTTIKQLPASPARPATPHCPPSVHETHTPPPIPPRSLQRPVSMLTAPGERHIIALQRLLPHFPTSFYEPQESAWGVAKAPVEERVGVDVEAVVKKEKKEGRYQWHKTRLLLRFMSLCFNSTAIALVYHRFDDSHGFSGSYCFSDLYCSNDSYDFLTLWVYMIVRIPVALHMRTSA